MEFHLKHEDFLYFTLIFFPCVGLERDLAALGDKIRQLDETANRLMQTHPEAADTIYGKQREINELWTQLTAKVMGLRSFQDIL